jgi:alpha,alpha-trehalase
MKLPVTIDPRYHDAVIFDLDGVLTDTASVHRAAWASLFNDYLPQRPAHEDEDHSPFTDDDYRQLVDGKSRSNGVADFLASRGISLQRGVSSDTAEDTICGLGNRQQQLCADLLAHDVPLFEATVTLARKLQGIDVATAAHASSPSWQHVLKAAGVDDLFNVCIDDTVAGELGLAVNGDPVDLLEATRRLGVRPQRSVVVEYADAAVIADRGGGFALVIAVDRTGHTDELLRVGADIVVADLADVAVRTGDKRMSEIPNALESSGQLIGITSARESMLFLDYDGTLSPIVSDPSAATLADGAAEALELVAAVCPVAVLSGRDLADIRTRVGTTRDLVCRQPRVRADRARRQPPPERSGRRRCACPQRAAGELRDSLAQIPGVRVEHKRFAVAVHYREVAPEHIGEIVAATHRLGQRGGLRVTNGRMLVELRPDIDWDKGTTLAWIRDRIDAAGSLLPIYIGDDLTDEDAFDAVQFDGIGIVVRHDEDGDRTTAAHFTLHSPDQVREFLQRGSQWLAYKH